MGEHGRTNDVERWRAHWEENNSPWHKDRVHPYLLKYIDQFLSKKPGAFILVPFCGKVKDMKWLAQRGYNVVGIEVSNRAIIDFFKEQDIKYSVHEATLQRNSCQLYESDDRRIKLYCADFFDCTKYMDIMLNSGILKPDVTYLLESYDYDTTQYTYGPNYISEAEIEELFQVGLLMKSTRLEYEDYSLFPFLKGGAKLRLHMFTDIRHSTQQ